MVIDFHTHIFPDKIAEGTIRHLEEAGGIHAFTDGTLDGLRKSMKKSNIDSSVILPVVTKPSQFNSINEYAASINGRNGIISFGGIHPDTVDYEKEIDTIKSLGLPGVKLHPDYQTTFIDDKRYVNIIRYALKKELLISIHAGIDIGLPEVVHCTPIRVKSMLQQISDVNQGNLKVILAHMGGFNCWDEVETMLVGSNVMFDISYSFGHINMDQMKRIILKHGAQNVLFASDSPWGGQKETLEKLKELHLSKEQEDMIRYQNAIRLLGLTNLEKD